jgi:hypothetical protein
MAKAFLPLQEEKVIIHHSAAVSKKKKNQSCTVSLHDSGCH